MNKIFTCFRRSSGILGGNDGLKSITSASTNDSTVNWRYCCVSNGISPVNISAATTANDQTSDNSETSLPLSIKISGALQFIFL